jgi:hypothetical protein
MNSRNLGLGNSGARGRLLAAVIGGGAIAVMGTFTVTHGGVQPSQGRIMSDSGDESKFPTFTPPTVPVMTSVASNMKMGATETDTPATALATTKAVPVITAAAG